MGGIPGQSAGSGPPDVRAWGLVAVMGIRSHSPGSWARQHLLISEEGPGGRVQAGPPASLGSLASWQLPPKYATPSNRYP